MKKGTENSKVQEEVSPTIHFCMAGRSPYSNAEVQGNGMAEQAIGNSREVVRSQKAVGNPKALFGSGSFDGGEGVPGRLRLYVLNWKMQPFSLHQEGKTCQNRIRIFIRTERILHIAVQTAKTEYGKE